MLYTTGLLYQPTTELLWTNVKAVKEPTFPGHTYYVQAQAILADVNGTIIVKPDRIGLRDKPGGKAWRLLADGEQPQCTCHDFQQHPVWNPRSMDRKRGYWSCTHTIAWNAYAGILNDHWRTLRVQTPLLIRNHEYWTGTMFKISAPTALIDFARWLQNQRPTLIQHSTQIASRDYTTIDYQH